MAPQCLPHYFLGLEPWYYYLPRAPVPGSSVCEITNFVFLGAHSSLLLIALAVLEDMLRLAGVAAVIYVIYGGVKYIMSQGSPDEVNKALTSIRHAVIGLIITIIAIPLVAFMAGVFVGGNAGNSTIPGLGLGSLPNIGDIASGNIIATLLGVFFQVAGALSLLFVVIGGYKYIMSRGDPQEVAKAKGTVLYAIIGLAVAIAAQSFISFVVLHLQ